MTIGCSRPTAFSRLILAFLALCLSFSASAQVERSGGGANAMLAQQYQQALAEKTHLQTDNQKLKSDLDATKKELEAAKRELSTAKTSSDTTLAQLRAAQSVSQADAQNLQQSKSRMDELVGRFRDTIATLKGVESDRTELQQQLAQSKQSYEQCVRANDDLYQINLEVLDRYSHQGAFSYMARAEPFTRIERVKIDNVALEYHQRAAQLKLESGAGGATGSSSSTTRAQ